MWNLDVYITSDSWLRRLPLYICITVFRYYRALDLSLDSAVLSVWSVFLSSLYWRLGDMGPGGTIRGQGSGQKLGHWKHDLKKDLWIKAASWLLWDDCYALPCAHALMAEPTATVRQSTWMEPSKLWAQGNLVFLSQTVPPESGKYTEHVLCGLGSEEEALLESSFHFCCPPLVCYCQVHTLCRLRQTCSDLTSLFPLVPVCSSTWGFVFFFTIGNILDSVYHPARAFNRDKPIS